MEISEKEYYELKEQVRILQEKVKILPKKTTTLADLVDNLPYDHVMKTVDDYPEFEYVRNTSGAWVHFTQLARVLHTPSYNFYMDRNSNYPSKPYIRSVGRHLAPRRLSDMKDEQIEISVQMLNEMIPIYDKYFKLTHQYVLYSDTDDGSYRKIYVDKEKESECWDATD